VEYTQELIENTMIVYMIENKINHKKYIGVSVNSFSKRYPHGIRAHHNQHLRRAVAEYGQDCFDARLLEKNVKDCKTLEQLEIQHIKEYDTCNKEKGYNVSLGGRGVRVTERTKTHCLHLSEAKKKAAVNTLLRMSDETLTEWIKKHSENVRGAKNPMYGMTADKLKPETLAKLREASLGKNNSMYGKNIKDFMTEADYENWKKKVARVGEKNGMARATVVIYKNQWHDFDYAQQAIDYFKTRGEYITKNWFYKGISETYKSVCQFVGYKDELNKLTRNEIADELVGLFVSRGWSLL